MRLAYLGRNVWHRVRRPLSLGTRALLIDPRDRVLLIRHSYIPGWHMPGGGVGKGESLRQAAAREVREEVGLDLVGRIDLFGIYARFRHGASDHVALFVARDWRNEPRVDGLEIVETEFFPLESLPPDLSPGTRRRIDEWRGGHPPAEAW
jgi:ADP-ribose pyrophosphatase YjhB (NUDIX family)